MIRRELPRTRNASSGARPYRIKLRRVLLAVSPSLATEAASKKCNACFSGSFRLRLRFGFDGNGPSKAQQFTSNSSDDLGFILAGRRELFIACTQTPLRLPGDVLDFLLQALLSFQQKAAHPRFVLVGPGCFDHHSSQMSVAGLGDSASLDAVAARVFTRNQPAVAHQLTRILRRGFFPNARSRPCRRTE